MITIFENYKKEPNIDSVSQEFWKMIRVANWTLFINKYKNRQGKLYIDVLEEEKYKLYSKYEFYKIKKFEKEYDIIYGELYDYFLFSTKNVKISSDGYSDAISSLIGRGKMFIKKCIKDPKIFIKTIESDDYAENFVYLLQIDISDYNKVKSKYNLLFGTTLKYNI